ncbi:MAG TPA: hypothetical protein VKH41_15910 [Myxococcota bacterium]|nr:hypothetical protein [Myxococcota bacterium]
MAAGEDPAPPEPGEDARGTDLWLAPFFRDSTLWPVLVTAAGAFTALGAWSLLVAFVEHNPFGVAAVLVLLWITVDAAIRYRRSPGSRFLLGSIAAFWILSICSAVGVRWLGWF